MHNSGSSDKFLDVQRGCFTVNFAHVKLFERRLMTSDGRLQESVSLNEGIPDPAFKRLIVLDSEGNVRDNCVVCACHEANFILRK